MTFPEPLDTLSRGELVVLERLVRETRFETGRY